MKTFVFTLLTILLLPAYGQDSHNTTEINAFVIDGHSGEPIIFTPIKMDSIVLVNTDVNGYFKLKLPSDSIIVLTISGLNYSDLEMRSDSIVNPIKLFLEPIDFTNIIIESNCNYPGRPINRYRIQPKNADWEPKKFYRNGKKKSDFVGVAYNIWFRKGQLKYQCVGSTDTYYYRNGQVKATGRMTKNHNSRLVKQDDWKYWKKNGKKKTKR